MLAWRCLTSRADLTVFAYRSYMCLLTPVYACLHDHSMRIAGDVSMEQANETNGSTERAMEPVTTQRSIA